MDNLTTTEIISYICAVLVGLFYVAILWKNLGLIKILLVIIVCCAIDTDHFLFNSQGFREHPTGDKVIMHAFHTIEFAIIVLSMNIVIGYHTITKGWTNWLFPKMEDFTTKTQYSISWITRIILLGVGLHYAQDIPIYAIQWKWGYYDYSIIHYLLM